MQSQRYAAVLRAFGVAQGDRVAMRGSNTAKCLFTMLALERLGAVRVLCEESWTAERIVQCVVDAHATTLIANRRYRAELDAVRDRMPAVERFIIVGEEREGWARLDSLVTRAQPYTGTITKCSDPAFIVDGSMYPQQSLYDAAIESAGRLQLAQTDRFWAPFPLGTTEWIVNTLVAGWSCGAAIVLHEGVFDPRERMELLRELDVTVLLQTAAEYEALVVAECAGDVRLPRLRRCLATGNAPGSAAGIPIQSVASGVRSLQTA